MKKKVRHKAGDIVAIPLPSGCFALGRVYSFGLLGVYDATFREIPTIEIIRQLPTAFVTGVFATAIQDGSWRIIGNVPFANKEETWGPPRYVQDFINPKKFRIYQKGKMRPATEAEVRGLERLEMYKPEQLVDRIEKELMPPDGKASPKAIRRNVRSEKRRSEYTE